LKSLSFATLIFALWVLLSGHFEPLLLGLGLGSTVFTVLLAKRMHVVDDESYPFRLLIRLLRYHGFLAREVFLANLDVAKRILLPSKSISPHLIDVEVPQRTDLGRVIYANSITVTPGTVTVRLDEDRILVHALSEEGAEDLCNGRMARAVPELDSEDGR
jgi:multicomponent Na+:H+ antiporter subunit E